VGLIKKRKDALKYAETPEFQRSYDGNPAGVPSAPNPTTPSPPMQQQPQPAPVEQAPVEPARRELSYRELAGWSTTEILVLLTEILATESKILGVLEDILAEGEQK